MRHSNEMYMYIFVVSLLKALLCSLCSSSHILSYITERNLIFYRKCAGFCEEMNLPYLHAISVMLHIQLYVYMKQILILLRILNVQLTSFMTINIYIY